MRQLCCEKPAQRLFTTLLNAGCHLQGSTNDLQLLILLNLTIIIIGSTLRHFIIHRNLPNGAEPTFGQDLYRVSLLQLVCSLPCTVD